MKILALSLGLAALSLPAWSQDPAPAKAGLERSFPAREHYSPYAGRNFPTRVFWGDTHLHTGMSMDAGAFGARLTPARCVPLRARRGAHVLDRAAA